MEAPSKITQVYQSPQNEKLKSEPIPIQDKSSDTFRESAYSSDNTSTSPKLTERKVSKEEGFIGRLRSRSRSDSSAHKPKLENFPHGGKSPRSNNSGSRPQSPLNLQPIRPFLDEMHNRYKKIGLKSEDLSKFLPAENSKKYDNDFTQYLTELKPLDDPAMEFFVDAIRSGFQSGNLTFHTYQKFAAEITPELILEGIFLRLNDLNHELLKYVTLQKKKTALMETLHNFLNEINVTQLSEFLKLIDKIFPKKNKVIEPAGIIITTVIGGRFVLDILRKYESGHEQDSLLFKKLESGCLCIAELCDGELKAPGKEHLCWTEHLYVKKTIDLKPLENTSKKSVISNARSSASNSSSSLVEEASAKLHPYFKNFEQKENKFPYTFALDGKQMINLASFEAYPYENVYKSLKSDAMPCFIAMNGQTFYTKSSSYIPLSSQLHPLSKSYQAYLSFKEAHLSFVSQENLFYELHLALYAKFNDEKSVSSSHVKDEVSKFKECAHDPYILKKWMPPLKVTTLMSDRCALRAIIILSLLNPEFFPEENNLISDYAIRYKDEKGELLKDHLEFHINITDRENVKVNHINQLTIYTRTNEIAANLTYSWVNHAQASKWESTLVIEGCEVLNMAHWKKIKEILNNPQMIKEIADLTGVKLETKIL